MKQSVKFRSITAVEECMRTLREVETDIDGPNHVAIYAIEDALLNLNDALIALRLEV